MSDFLSAKAAAPPALSSKRVATGLVLCWQRPAIGLKRRHKTSEDNPSDVCSLLADRGLFRPGDARWKIGVERCFLDIHAATSPSRPCALGRQCRVGTYSEISSPPTDIASGTCFRTRRRERAGEGVAIDFQGFWAGMVVFPWPQKS